MRTCTAACMKTRGQLVGLLLGSVTHWPSLTGNTQHCTCYKRSTAWEGSVDSWRYLLTPSASPPHLHHECSPVCLRYYSASKMVLDSLDEIHLNLAGIWQIEQNHSEQPEVQEGHLEISTRLFFKNINIMNTTVTSVRNTQT